MAAGQVNLPPGFELEQQSGMLQPGNIDLYNRPHVKNPDGSVSTVRSLGVNVGGKEVLIPTVSQDGRILSNQDAVAEYKRTGKHLGIFDSPQSSTAYAQQLHNDYAAGKYDQKAGVKLPPGFQLEQPATATGERKGFIERGLGDVADTLKGFGELFHPEPKTDIEKGLATSGNPLVLPLHRAIVGYYGATKQSIKRAEEAGEKGDKTGVLINSAAAGLPLVGPLVSGVYEQSGKGDPLGDVGLAASRVIQALSMAPEGSALPNPVAAAGRAVSAVAGKAPAAMEAVAPVAGKVAQSAKAVGSPLVRAGLEALKDVPVVRGVLKGVTTFKDVPAQLREIWAKDSPRAPHLQAAIEDLASQLETKAATNSGPTEAEPALEAARRGSSVETPATAENQVPPEQRASTQIIEAQRSGANRLDARASAKEKLPSKYPSASSARQSFADAREDAAIRNSVQEESAKADRKAFSEERQQFAAGNSVDKPKWLRQAEAKAAQLIADAEVKANTPTKYTKTVTPKPKMTPAMAQSKYNFLRQKSEAGQSLTTADQKFLQDFETTKEAVSSLEDMLRQSIEQVKAKKAGK